MRLKRRKRNTYDRSIATPNKVIQDEKFNFFKFEYTNKDFTVKEGGI